MKTRLRRRVAEGRSRLSMWRSGQRLSQYRGMCDFDILCLHWIPVVDTESSFGDWLVGARSIKTSNIITV